MDRSDKIIIRICFWEKAVLTVRNLPSTQFCCTPVKFLICLFRTPNILNKDPTDDKPKHEKPPSPLKHEFDPTGKRTRLFPIHFTTLLTCVE